MAVQGLLQGLAHQELDALLEEIRAAYRPGALESMAAGDPEWRRALERAEAEVGLIYQALGEADTAVARWHRALGELRRLWTRVTTTGATPSSGALEEVA